MVRFVFCLLITLGFFCCRKNAEVNRSVVQLNDSLVVVSPAVYPVDLNRDGTKDVRIHGSWTGWQTWQSGLFYVTKSNPQVQMHLVKSTQALCQDSVMFGGYLVPQTAPCNGNGQQLRVDSFVHAPNLTLEQAEHTLVNELLTDTLLIYQNYHTVPMPSPFASFYSWSHGFFHEKKEGYLLFALDQQKYALKIRLDIPYLYFDALHPLD